MSIQTHVRYFAGRRGCEDHQITLVFADRTRQVEGSVWGPAYHDPTSWVADLGSPALLGIVHHSPAGGYGTHVDRTDGRGTIYGKADTLADAIQQVRTEHAEMLAEQARREIDPVYALEAELQCHDWWHHMSDDGAVYRGGEAHWQLIQELVRRSPADAVRTLWTRYAPDGFGCPV